MKIQRGQRIVIYPARQPGFFAQVATGAVLLAVAACCTGVLGALLGLFSLFGTDDLGGVVWFALGAAALVSAHVGTSWWSITRRPGARLTTITQTPYAVAYGAFLVWWWHRYPLGYLIWATAVLAGFSWLLAWWLLGDVGKPKRAIVFLSLVGALIAGNGGVIAWQIWHDTRGFGLQGEETPWQAFDAVAATSCLSNIDFYHKAGNMTEAHCPSGPEHYRDRYRPDGGHDTDFDEMLTEAQPREAFAKWWGIQHTYDYSVSLRFWDRGEKRDGDTATLTQEVELLAHGAMPGDKLPHFDKLRETWEITLTKVAFGGWKVSHISIIDPITVTDSIVVPPDSPTPSPTASEGDPFRNYEMLPCGPRDPLRAFHDCPTPMPTYPPYR
jgi:hypothetical protein